MNVIAGNTMFPIHAKMSLKKACDRKRTPQKPSFGLEEKTTEEDVPHTQG